MMSMIRYGMLIGVLCLWSFTLFAQSPCPGCKIFSISSGPDINVTGSSPFQPVDGAFDANLNINTLTNALATGSVTVNESGFIGYEMVILDSVEYSSDHSLSLASFNNILCYADIKNDSTGSISISAQANVLVGTGSDWITIRGVPGQPICCMPVPPRTVEVGSRQGNTFINGTQNVYVLCAPGIPNTSARIGCRSQAGNASIDVFAGNHVLLNGGGADAHAQIGFGTDTTNATFACPITIICEEGNVWLYGSEENAYAQIGNRNIRSTTVGGDIMITVNSVPVNLPLNGNLRLQGGNMENAPAIVGHVHGSIQNDGRARGRIICNLSGSLSAFAGSGKHADARVGHSVSGGISNNARDPISIIAGQNVIADASAFTLDSTAHASIGHRMESFGSSKCQDTIYIECGVDSGGVYVIGGDMVDQFAIIGHHSVSGSNDLEGAIEILSNRNTTLKAGTGQRSRAHIGHFDEIPASNAMGTIRIRTGDSLQVFASNAMHPTAPARIGHRASNVLNDIFILAGGPVELKAGNNAPDTSSGAGIIAPDTVDIIAAGNIILSGGSAPAVIGTNGNGGVEVRSAGSLFCSSSADEPGGFLDNNGPGIRVQCADDIILNQKRLKALQANGYIYFWADKPWNQGELWKNQLNRDSMIGAFANTPLESENPVINADNVGAVQFNNPDTSTTLMTISGSTTLFNAPMTTDGLQSNLRISTYLPASLNWISNDGNLFIDMFFGPGNVLTERVSSNYNVVIEKYRGLHNGRLYLNVQNEIDIIDSELDLRECLLLTDTGIP